MKPVLLPLCHGSVHSQILCSWRSITGTYLSHDGLPPCPIDPQGTLIESNRNNVNARPPNSSDISLPRLSAMCRLGSRYHCLETPIASCKYGSEPIRPTLVATSRPALGATSGGMRLAIHDKREVMRKINHTSFRYCSGPEEGRC